MGTFVNQALGVLGLKLSRTAAANAAGLYSTLFNNGRVTELDGLVACARGIPGMLSEESGKFLFALCHMQQLEGDVVEIGSWQGYSTSYLARAVAESGRGRMYAIDHFGGNVGKQALYRVKEPDLSDLERNFRNNMSRLGLDSVVRLLPVSSEEAAAQLRRESARIRFLFIDGDHSRQGVQRDVDLFFPLLRTGAIVVFDDCSPSAPGVIEVIDELLDRNVFDRAFAYPNSFVATVGRELG
ncbi:MAG: hypothetical protein A3G81_19495 [Betaproteobacteria bacterium RIFCSPLOWO2_12_FULL_65_14]|nr:MAG: hypothetical protein A3G81_19495 [Betaproteobacteria bacterium RIFCSPLOWO2_12_FULL_65_14]